ncbi:DUF4112 domain-containing protein [Novosphingobium olei]|uniref:DUF4112 domain-containing protein n=1 Tax=Novosphingobium olei TaxID=2728851 RepID=A0A7Y0BRV9_9SPHN|nr:DUF4112 domain-containing protein [Novosphingobium olei]NML95472.1 DUF4112 domain-containing protein [Novosphingobium olei]
MNASASAAPASRPRRYLPDMPGLGRDPASVRARIEALEFVLERAVQVPGLKRAIGLDAIAGLVPVVGDLVTAALGFWLVWEARNLGLPRWRLWQMSANVAFDTAVGAVPVVGDAFDVLFRSNSRNLKIIRKHLDRHHPASGVIEG